MIKVTIEGEAKTINDFVVSMTQVVDQLHHLCATQGDDFITRVPDRTIGFTVVDKAVIVVKLEDAPDD